MLFGDVVQLFRELAAAFLGERGDGDAHQFAVI
jgi:hypothetical protein